jgi:uncharacterized protein (AIM24 family)
VAKFDHVGEVSPALLLQLAPGERVMVTVDSVRYRDPSVAVNRMKYTFPDPTGQSLIQNWHYFETLDGPGTATLSTGIVGEIRFGHLNAGEQFLLHAGALLAHEATMRYDRVVLAVYQMVNANQPSYLTAARLIGPGSFAFQTHGNALSFNLKPGEWIRTDPEALLSISPGMPIRVTVIGGSPNFPPGHYFPIVDIAGPGTALVHSGRFLVGAPQE